jgi:adenylosuccinate lyase
LAAVSLLGPLIESSCMAFARMIGDEAIMLELGKTIGRQHAHDVVYEAAQAAPSQNISFPDRLAADHRVTAYLSRSAIDGLLEECGYNELPENGCGDLLDSRLYSQTQSY